MGASVYKHLLMMRCDGFVLKGFRLIVLTCCLCCFVIGQNNLKENTNSLVKTKSDTYTKAAYDFFLCDLFSYEPATFPGGIEGWAKFLSDSLTYPYSGLCYHQPLKVEIKIKFIIETDGSIMHIECLDPLQDSAFYHAAVEVMKISPKWMTAKRNGTAIANAVVQKFIFMTMDEQDFKKEIPSACDGHIFEKLAPIL